MSKFLYHYTSIYHLPRILESQFLKLTESNLRLEKEMYKPVVWMTTDSDVVGHGLEGSVVDKTEVKITIRSQPHFKYWNVWSRQNKISKKWAASLEKGQKPNTWWVSEKIVDFSQIEKIENRYTGEIYYQNPNM